MGSKLNDRFLSRYKVIAIKPNERYDVMSVSYLSNCTSSGVDNMKLFNSVSSGNNKSSNDENDVKKGGGYEVELRLAIIRGGLKVRIGQIVEFYMEQLSIP
jgi:hypothetical protein